MRQLRFWQRHSHWQECEDWIPLRAGTTVEARQRRRLLLDIVKTKFCIMYVNLQQPEIYATPRHTRPPAPAGAGRPCESAIPRNTTAPPSQATSYLAGLRSRRERERWRISNEDVSFASNICGRTDDGSAFGHPQIRHRRPPCSWTGDTATRMTEREREREREREATIETHDLTS